MLARLFYLLIAGIGRELLPKGCPSSKAVQRRLQGWLALNCFYAAWQQLAEQYVQLHGINWDQILFNGSLVLRFVPILFPYSSLP